MSLSRFLGRHFSTSLPTAVFHFLMIVLHFLTTLPHFPPQLLPTEGNCGVALPTRPGFSVQHFLYRQSLDTLLRGNAHSPLPLQTLLPLFSACPLLWDFSRREKNTSALVSSMLYKLQRAYLKCFSEHSFIVHLWPQRTVWQISLQIPHWGIKFHSAFLRAPCLIDSSLGKVRGKARLS